MKTLYTLLSILFVVVLPMETHGTHVVGADINYTWLGGNNYIVRLFFYRDCSGINPPSSITLQAYSQSCGLTQNYSLPLLNPVGTEINPPCSLGATTCSGGTYFGIQEYIYEATITLPTNCSDWRFHYSVCCRSANIINISNPGGSAQYFYSYLDNLNITGNNSPVFNNQPVTFHCVSSPFCYDFSATDSDGDSLVYTLVNPMKTTTQPVTWNPGYSTQYPINSNPLMTLDPQTGLMCVSPLTQGVYALAVRVDEYRNNQWIGSIVRDINVNLVNCSTSPVVNCPSDITVNNDPGQCGAIVNYSATSQDTSAIITYSIQPGSFFNIGTTSVTATVSNSNSCGPDSCTFNVTVLDNENPVITCPPTVSLSADSGHCNVMPQWLLNQKGTDIDGEAAGDYSGISVSMADANTLAIGAYGNDGNGVGSGHVRIYSWNGTAWIQKGTNIDGEAAGDQSGWSVSMPDANTVAIGAPGNDGNGVGSGHVRIYSWNGTAWVQKGADIDGELASDNSARVSMPDSNTIAIGAYANDGNGNFAGHVRVYFWNGTAWIRKGMDIDGEAAGDHSGRSVSMPDANTVAIGASYNDGNGIDAGHVRIYSWNGSAWIQKGMDIEGEAAGDYSGRSVSMPDANTVAIGALGNDGNGIDAGHVRIYTWNGTAWTQKGIDIDGEAADDNSAGWYESVSMPNANTVAIGAGGNDGNGINAGHVRIYSWNGTAWVQKGADIDGEAAGDQSGISVCMPDANVVAIGAAGNDGNGVSAGHVRIYRLNSVLTPPAATDNCAGVTISGPVPAGSYPVGTTTVTWTATDASGNIATCTQDVNITDNENPVITCPPTVNLFTDPGLNTSSGPIGTPVTNDNCGVASVTNNNPGPYPIGTTTVTWTVTDIYGNTATCNQDVIVSPSCSLPSYIPTTGLEGYWPFCGNANDVSGNGNHGTANGAILANDRYGNPNSAYSFDGSDDEIRIPHSSALNLSGDFSISAWFYSTNPPAINNDHTIIGKRDDGGTCCSPNCPYELSINYQQNGTDYKKPLFSAINNSSPSYSQTSDTILIDTWQHIVLTYTGDSIRMYLDGDIIHTEYFPASNRNTNTSDLLFGSVNRAFGDEYFEGYLDDIGLWKRALTGVEVENIYNSCLGITVNLGPDVSHCGNSVMLDAGTGYATYAWSTGETTQTINASVSGNYSVVVSDTAGCLGTDTIAVDLLSVSITPGNTTICAGDSLQLSVNNVSGVPNFGSIFLSAQTIVYPNIHSTGGAYFSDAINLNDQTFAVSGVYYDGTMANQLAVRLDTSGAILWTTKRDPGWDHGRFYNVSKHGQDLLFSGMQNGQGSCYFDPVFVRYDINGTELGYNTQCIGASTDDIRNIIKLDNNGYLTCGASSPTGNYACYLDNTLNQQLINIIPKNNNAQRITKILLGAGGGRYMIGPVESDPSYDVDAIVIKLDSLLNVTSTYLIPGVGDEYIFDGLISNNIITMCGRSVTSGNQAYFAQINTNGSSVITKTLNWQNQTTAQWIVKLGSGFVSLIEQDNNNGSSFLIYMDENFVVLDSIELNNPIPYSWFFNNTNPLTENLIGNKFYFVGNVANSSATSPVDISTKPCLTKIEIDTNFLAQSNITYLWSNGATTASINVNPAQTTTYYVTVSNGVTTCTDSVTVTVTAGITCPPAANLTTDSGQCTSGASIGTATAGCQATVSGPVPAGPYPVGTTTVTWTATYPSGTSTTCTQNVTVTDNEDPTITCPPTANLVTDPGQNTSSGSIGIPVTSDNCGVDTVTNNNPGPYPIGTTVVTWTVTDIYGNTATCNQDVNVTLSCSPPTISCPADIIVSNDAGQCGAAVTFNATASGNPAPTITYSHTPGSFFNVGTTNVTAVATNSCGTDTCRFNITVNDTEAPVISGGPGNISSCNPVSWTEPTVSDNCIGAVISSSHAPGTTFPSGTTTVTYTAVDASLLSSTYSFDVTVLDAPSPIDSITASGYLDHICAGQSATLNAWTDSLGYQGKIMWYSGGCGPTLGGTYIGMGASITVSPISTTSYYARVEGFCDTTSCESITIGVSSGAPGNITSAIGAPAYTYPGDTFNLTWSGSVGAAFYTISTNQLNTYLADGQPLPYTTTNPFAEIVVLQSQSNHHFWIRASNACGQSSGRKHIRIRGNVAEPGPITASSAVTCPDSCVTYTVPPLDASVQFNWTISPAGAGTITSNNGDNSSVTICYSSTFSGTATICVAGQTTFGLTGPQTCITVSNTTEIPGLISGNITPCADGSTVYNYSIVPVPGAVSYNWYLNGVLQTNTTGTTGGIVFPAGFTSGTVCVTTISSCGTESGQSCLNITQGLTASPGAIIGLTTGLCGLNPGYSVPNTGASSYNWSLDPAAAGSIISGNGSNSVIVHYSGSYTGLATLKVVASYLCGVDSSTLVINGAPDKPSVFPLTICPGTNSTYSAVSGNTNSYLWTIGGATSWIPTAPDSSSVLVEWMPLPATNQTFTVSALNGCGASVGFTLNENCPLPRLSADQIDVSVYPNPTRGMITMEIGGISEQKAVVKFYDLVGRIIRSKQINISRGISYHEFDLTDVRKGMYLIEVEHINGKSVERLVIE